MVQPAPKGKGKGVLKHPQLDSSAHRQQPPKHVGFAEGTDSDSTEEPFRIAAKRPGPDDKQPHKRGRTDLASKASSSKASSSKASSSGSRNASRPPSPGPPSFPPHPAVSLLAPPPAPVAAAPVVDFGGLAGALQGLTPEQAQTLPVLSWLICSLDFRRPSPFQRSICYLGSSR